MSCTVQENDPGTPEWRDRLKMAKGLSLQQSEFIDREFERRDMVARVAAGGEEELPVVRQYREKLQEMSKRIGQLESDLAMATRTPEEAEAIHQRRLARNLAIDRRTKLVVGHLHRLIRAKLGHEAGQTLIDEAHEAATIAVPHIPN